jgi:surface antigen
MFRAALLALPLLALPASLPAPAAAADTAAAQSRTGEDCQRQNQRQRRRGRGIGGFLGGIAGGLGGRAGGVANVVTNILPVGQLLGEAIANLLDCDEQQKAATATEQVTERVERDGVGASASWRSETRPGVAGSSTVTAVEARAPDGECLTITDIVIVDGQETTAPKRMCRRPPNNRYVRV